MHEINIHIMQHSLRFLQLTSKMEIHQSQNANSTANTAKIEDKKHSYGVDNNSDRNENKKSDSIDENDQLSQKFAGLTKREENEYENLVTNDKNGYRMHHDADLKYMISTGIVEITKAMCDFDLDNYDTDDVLRYMRRIKPSQNHDYPIDAMREHVRKFLFYRLKEMVDFVFSIGLGYHISFYHVS